MFHKHWIGVFNSILTLILFVVWTSIPYEPNKNQLLLDPGEPGPCTSEEMSLDLQGIETKIFIPLPGSCSTWSNAPYPGLVFAHGFSMMGFTDGVADMKGNGAHLSSWGYWVAIPALPDDAESRISDLRIAIDTLLLLTNQPGSQLYQKIDPQRLAVAGYSLGGATALAAAARDIRIQTAVALDPVYHEGGFSGEGAAVWNPEEDGEKIAVPTGILGSPPSSCNAQADYQDIYGYVAATHKAAYQVTGASHCDFLDPGNSFCSLFCSGNVDPEHTHLSQRYMTAWFNYYLLLRDEFYTTLFGNGLNQDISLNIIQADIATEARGFRGVGNGERVLLSWDMYDQPVLGGYFIYRREPGQVYSAESYVQLDMTDRYLDLSVIAGQEYYYKLCSYDLGENQHACSEELAVTAGGSEAVFLPLINRP